MIHSLRPDHIDLNHWEELIVGSGIDPELASLNIVSLSGDAAPDYLLYSDKIERRNTGRLINYWINSYRHLEAGGWWCNGINLVDGSDTQWGCLKPNKPRHRQDKDGKIIKYEHPPKTNTECFFLKVSANIWELIAAKAGVSSLPENYQDVTRNPLLFWSWVIENNIPTLLTEGVKKTLAGLTAGYVCVGFPGISSIAKQPKDEEGSKVGKPYLIPQLLPFLGSKRKIIFAFDSDIKAKTIKNVNLQINKAGELLQYRSCSVHIATWEHQLGKGLDDILVNCGVEKIDEIYRTCKKFHEWKTAQLNQLTYSPNIELDRKYLLVDDGKGNRKPDFKLSSDWTLLWLKAHKGAGKTSLIDYIVSPLVASGERKVLLITHRVALGKSICNNLGLQYIDEKSEEDHKRHLGLCIDSLLKLNPDDWKGCYLILDEIQQLIWHALNSSTCRKKRVAILKQFKKLLNIIHQSGGKIIIADADLRDDGIDFIVNQIDDEVKTFGILNNYIKDDKDKWKVYNYADKDPARLISDLIEKLACGKKILTCTSGQKANSTWGTQNLEAYIKEILPDIKILRIDSLSVGEIGHPAFGALNHFRESIEGYQLVICSPTTETGVDLNFDYFDCVFGIFQGVQPCDSVRQHLSRYRKPVPRYLFISTTGINSNRIGNGANNVRALLAGEYKKDKANILNLIPLGFENLEGNYENSYLTHWAICGALINDGFKKYRHQILEDLKSEGHQIIDFKKDENEEYSAEGVKESKQKIYLEHAKTIEDAKDIDKEEYERLDKKPTLTKEERYQKDKFKLADRYQIPVTANLVIKNDDNFYSQIRLHYLIENFDSFIRQEKNYFSAAIKNDDGHRAIWDDNRQSLGAKIHSLIIICRIREVLSTDGLHEYHPLAIEVGNAVRANIHDLKLLLCDLRDPKKPQPSNMFILRRLVGLIGYKLPQLKEQITVEAQDQGIKKRVRLHDLPQADLFCMDPNKEERKLILGADGRLVASPDDREVIFSAWQEKEAIEIIKEQEIEAARAAAASDLANRIEISKELTQQLISEMSQSDEYALTRQMFESNLKEATNNNDYWECVALVNELEASIIPANNFGYLAGNHAAHNNQIRKIIEDVLTVNSAAIRALQIHQSKWEEGDRQLIATPKKEESLVIPVKQLSIPVGEPRRKSIVNQPEQELEEKAVIEKCKDLIINSMLEDAKNLIESMGYPIKLAIKHWLKTEQYPKAMDMVASLV